MANQFELCRSSAPRRPPRDDRARRCPTRDTAGPWRALAQALHFAPSRKLSHTHTHTKLKHTHQTRPLILYCFATRPFGQTQSYRTSLAQSNRKNRQGSSRWLHCPLFVDCNKQVPLFRCTTLPHSTDLPRTQELVIEHRTSPRAGSNLQRRTRSDAHKLLRILGLPPRAPHRQHLTPDVLLHRLQLVPGLQADRPGHLGVVAGGHVHHARQRPHTLLDTRLLPLIVPGATRKRRLGAKDGRGGVNRLQRCAEARAGQRGGARGAPSLCRQEADVSDGLVLQGHHSAVVCVCVFWGWERGGGGGRGSPCTPRSSRSGRSRTGAPAACRPKKPAGPHNARPSLCSATGSCRSGQPLRASCTFLPGCSRTGGICTCSDCTGRGPDSCRAA